MDKDPRKHKIARLLQETPALLDCLYIINVEAAVYHQGRYLMILRGPAEANAPGTLSFPGGKIERAGDSPEIVEATLRREIREEAGVEVADLVYLKSKSFTGADGKPIVDLFFLARYQSGEPGVSAEPEPGEIAGLAWMDPAEVLSHPKAPAWTREDLRDAEIARQRLGW
jgi:8-oxo-dGTP diphosphatase